MPAGTEPDNLEIRPFEPGDFEAWRQLHLSLPAPKNTWDIHPKKKEDVTKANFKKVLKKHADLRNKDVYYDLPIFLPDGQLIGGVAVMEVSRAISQTAFLGYLVFNPFWGKGYGKEAVRLALDVAFTDLKLHRVEAGIEPGNHRSIALAKSLKMRREGLKKRALFLRQKWVDLLMYTLTCEDLGYPVKSEIVKPTNRR